MTTKVNDSQGPANIDSNMNQQPADNKGQLQGREVVKILKGSSGHEQFAREFPMLNLISTVFFGALAFTCVFSFSITSIFAGLCLGSVSALQGKAIYDTTKSWTDLILLFKNVSTEFGNTVGVYFNKSNQASAKV